jgi:hypothetical protein
MFPGVPGYLQHSLVGNTNQLKPSGPHIRCRPNKKSKMLLTSTLLPHTVSVLICTNREPAFAFLKGAIHAPGPGVCTLIPIRLRSHMLVQIGWFAILLLCSVFFVRSVAHAQGGVPLIRVATDQSLSVSVSNQFGVPAAQAIDQAGDLVFIGRGGSALFFRAAGAASATTRLLQTGDQVPGFPGSHVMSFPSAVSINSSGKIIFAVAYSLPDALPHQALLTYNTGSGYQKIVSSDDPSPAGGASMALPFCR